MSLWNLEPIPPPRNRPRSLLVGALLILASFIVVGGLLMLERGELAFAPTPTPTATNAPLKSSTPDVRATLVVEDMITQQANPIVLDLGATPPAQSVAQQPGPDATAPLVTTIGTPSGQQVVQPTSVEGPQGTVTVSLNLPYVPSLSTPVSIIPTPIPTNPPPSTELTAVAPTPLPATATVIQASPTPSPTPSFTTTPTPLPTPYVVDRLFANIEKIGVKRQRGPSSHYENDGEFERGDVWL